MEFIFCLINERELFNAIKTLIDSKMQSSSTSYQELQFTIIGYQMLNILIEHVRRTQIHQYESAYLELTKAKLEAQGPSNLPIQIRFQCLKAFNKLLPLMKQSTFAE